MRRIFLAFVLLVLPQLLCADDLAGFEKVLLPVFTIEPIEGVGGLFFTQLYVLGEREFRYYPAPGFGGRPSIAKQPALSPFPSVFAGLRVSHGLFLFVERNEIDELTFSYELHSSATRTAGGGVTILPIVRERESLSGPARIVGVLSRANVSQSNELLGFLQRNHLRIYDLEGSGQLRVRVRVRAIWPSPGAVIGEEIVAVDHRDGSDIAFPFFTELLLPACVPDPPRQCGDGRTTVELTPLTAAKYYAFVSSTNNQSQEVLIFTPERR